MVKGKYIRTEETRLKTRNSLLGHLNSEETRQKIKDALFMKRQKLGHKDFLSPETRADLSKKLKGRISPTKGMKFPEELYPNHGMRNKKNSEETREKIKESAKNNINFGMRNKLQTEEAKEKMRIHSSKGKNLKNQNVIHHINGNHFDNRPENRMAITRSEHIKIHRLQGDLKYFNNNLEVKK